MDRHWNRHEQHFACLARTATARQRARTWPQLEPALDLGPINSALDVIAWIRHQRTADADPALAALVRLAVDGDQLAAATVTRCLHPGLAGVVTKVADAHSSRRDVIDTVLGLCWERIVTYPIERRPRMIALNILLDVRQRYTRSQRRTRQASRTEQPLECVTDLRATGADIADRVAADDLAAYLLRNLRPGETEVLIRTRVAGETTDEAAAAMGLSRRTILAKRYRAEQRCRTLAAA